MPRTLRSVPTRRQHQRSPNTRGHVRYTTEESPPPDAALDLLDVSLVRATAHSRCDPAVFIEYGSGDETVAGIRHQRRG